MNDMGQGEWNARDIHQQSATDCDKCGKPEFPDCMIKAGFNDLCLRCATDVLEMMGYRVSFHRGGDAVQQST